MSHEPQSSYCANPEAEPTSAPTTVPMWLIVVMLLLLFLGAWYFDARGGWFAPKVYAPYVSIPDLERFQPPKSGEEWRPRGKALFESNCALCHNTDGSGKPGQAPPLAGSEWVLAPGVNRLIRIPQVGLAGPIKVKGQEWNLNMAGMGAAYSDEQLADVLSYIRNSFGNKASVVTAEQVKKVRAELGGRSQPLSADELMTLPE
jgi:mono/diheme cytochrome c family protein